MFQRHVINEHDEEESIFISMTDLTVSMMLLLVILLGFFASQFRNASISEQTESAALQIVSLHDELDQLSERLISSSEENLILESQLQEAISVIRENERTIEGLHYLQSENLSLQMELEGLADFVSTSSQQFEFAVANLNQRIEGLEAEISTMRNNHTREIERLQLQEITAEQDFLAARSEINRLQDQINELNFLFNAERRNLNDQMDFLQAQWQNATEEVEVLRGAATASLDAWRREESAFNEQIADLQRSLAEVEADRLREADVLGARLEAMGAALSDAQARETALREMLFATSTASTFEMQSVLEQLATLREENLTLQAENGTLLEAAAASRREYDLATAAQQQRIYELERELSDVALGRPSAADFVQFSENLAAANEQIRALQDNLEMSQEREQQAFNSVNDLLFEVGELRLENAVLSQEVQSKNTEISSLISQLSTLEDLLASVMESTTSLLEGPATVRPSSVPD